MNHFIEQLVREAGAIARRRYDKTVVGESKSSRIDVVTAVDRELQTLLTDQVRSTYPDHTVISEEGMNGTLGDKTWIFDPIDGTLNFATHVPLFGVMAAYAEDGSVLLSAIYLPMFNELYLAERGSGAFHNGRPINCSAHPTIRESYSVLSQRIDDKQAWLTERLSARPEIRPLAVSSYNSIAIGACYVASGRRDWLVSFGEPLWDFAAPGLLLQEAGCTVGVAGGEPWSLGKRGPMLAANPTLYQELSAFVGDRPAG